MKPLARFAATALVALCAFPATGAEPSAPRVIRAHYTAEQQQVERYVNVPFEVAPGTTRIDIELQYDKAGGENVVDLGLLEPGPLTLSTRAFRGWTGGERSAIFVTANDATPGYWPGPIEAGRWHVGLGLYKVGARGVDVQVTVRTSTDPQGPDAPPALSPRPREPIRVGPAWYAGALHAHTHNSDGALSAQALAEKARADGLDFLAITDHNNTAHQREAINVPGLLTIVGEEVTTPGGHANVWGLGGVRDFIDFRVLPGDPAIGALVKAVTERGAVMGINHPFSACVACSWTHPIPEGISTVEITGREPEEMPRAVALWDTLLRQGRRITAVGVSDWHRGEAPLGAASVRVWAPELSTAAILESLRAGRVVVMIDGATPPPEVRVTAGTRGARIGETLGLAPGEAYAVTVSAEAPLFKDAVAQLFWQGELVATAPLVDGQVRFDRFASTNGYLRVHLVTPAGMPLAVTNPIWLRMAGR